MGKSTINGYLTCLIFSDISDTLLQKKIVNEYPLIVDISCA